MNSFGIQRGRLFPLVQDSEKYVLFLTNSNPDPNIIITEPSMPGPAAYPLPVRRPSRLRGGAGRGRGASDNRDLVDVVVLVVSVVIVFVPVPEVDLGNRLWEMER